VIPNHQAAKLSELDLRMAANVPPGGNWRDIPLAVPSERLAQIRRSAAAGEGSRSTYYGRLRPDLPAYTIGTYYNRPGNGCFLHFDRNQSRTLSHREAARLQSFPDSFVFAGPQRAVCQQIGNAVPPLLAFQIAQALGPSGSMIDVFAGAGGLSLGFKWAGWRTLAATDIDPHAIDTFNANVSPLAFVGDMNDDEVLERLSSSVALEDRQRGPLALVGGPPCQGFSTGGKRRSEEDARNNLYSRYALLLRLIQPNVFVFENVMGLLSLSGGRFLQRILGELGSAGYEVEVWKTNAAEFGVPQRRQRVLIIGVRSGQAHPTRLNAWTTVNPSGLLGLPAAISVEEAIGDLPPIEAGEDGSWQEYALPATSRYQRLMRGEISPADYLAGQQIGAGQRAA